MSGDYVSIYSQTAFADGEIVPLISLLFLFFGRMLPIIAMPPFFGGKLLPRPAKVGLALSLFAVFLPQLLTQTKVSALAFDFNLVLLLMKEVLIGVLLGFFLSIPFIIVQSTGILIDHQRGASSLMVNDPSVQMQSSPLGTLYNYLLIYLFFLMDGPYIVLDMISHSFTVVPVDKFLSASFFANTSQVVQHTLHILGTVMILATQLAAPALIMILMTDFFLGVANRLAPQVQITFLGMPLKSLLALTIVFFGWQLFMGEIVSQTHRALAYINQLISQFV